VKTAIGPPKGPVVAANTTVTPTTAPKAAAPATGSCCCAPCGTAAPAPTTDAAPAQSPAAVVKRASPPKQDQVKEKNGIRKRKIKITKEDKKGKTEADIIAGRYTAIKMPSAVSSSTVAAKAPAVNGTVTTGSTVQTLTEAQVLDAKILTPLLKKYEEKAAKLRVNVNSKAKLPLRLKSSNHLSVLLKRSGAELYMEVYQKKNLVFRKVFPEKPGTYLAVLRYLQKTSGNEELAPKQMAKLKTAIKAEGKLLVKSKVGKSIKKEIGRASKGEKKVKKTVKKGEKKVKKAVKKGEKKVKKVVKKADKKVHKAVKKGEKKAVHADMKVVTTKHEVNKKKNAIQIVKEQRDKLLKRVKGAIVKCKCLIIKPKRDQKCKSVAKINQVKVGDVTVSKGIKTDGKGKVLKTSAVSDSKGNTKLDAKAVDAAGRKVHIHREVRVLNKAEKAKLKAKLAKLEKKGQLSEKEQKKVKKIKMILKTGKREVNKTAKKANKDVKKTAKKAKKEVKKTVKKAKKKFKKTLTIQ